ncbi:MAG: alpha/beta hydrolase fold domain-containing protein [Oscillospiraceae bacterium]|nr:alpha/beta hydrolase fold domain-containing protein [Oscillospiraceae bacterium]
MAINKYMMKALKTVSNVYANVDIKANYKTIRRLKRRVVQSRIKLYQTWDYNIESDGCKIPVRMYSPEDERIDDADRKNYPIIVFFHGGGWVTGDLERYERTCLTTARLTGHIVVAVDYRLAPENPFPAALIDCYRVFRRVCKWHKLIGCPHKITLMGDSAGANLAAALSLYLRDKGERPADRQILIYPAVYNNHTETSPFPSIIENGKDYILASRHVCDYMDMYCPDEQDRLSPYVAPLLAEDFSGQPETLIITADCCPLRDEGEEFGRRLKAAGNTVVVRRVKNTLHGYFMLSTRFVAVRKSYSIINHFLRGGIRTNERFGQADVV